MNRKDIQFGSLPVERQTSESPLVERPKLSRRRVVTDLSKAAALFGTAAAFGTSQAFAGNDKEQANKERKAKK